MANKYKRRRSTLVATSEIQIKTIIKYYFRPTRTAIIKKSDNNKCYGETGNLNILLMEMLNGVVDVESSQAVLQKVKQDYHITSNSTPTYMLKINTNKYPHKNMHINAPSSIIRNSQKVVITQMLII